MVLGLRFAWGSAVEWPWGVLLLWGARLGRRCRGRVGDLCRWRGGRSRETRCLILCWFCLRIAQGSDNRGSRLSVCRAHRGQREVCRNWSTWHFPSLCQAWRYKVQAPHEFDFAHDNEELPISAVAQSPSLSSREPPHLPPTPHTKVGRPHQQIHIWDEKSTCSSSHHTNEWSTYTWWYFYA